MRARPMNVAVRLVAALAIALGASSQSLAALLCSSALCPMTVAVETKGCCDSEPAKQKESEKPCCCEFQNSPQTIRVDTPFAVSEADHAVAALPDDPAEAVQAVSIAAAQRIPFHSDHSPPQCHSLPDSERAPPLL